MDRWVGVPLCLLLSVFDALLRRLRRNRKQSVRAELPRRILFLELSEMGSAVMSYPAICRVREAFPDAELFFWVFRRNRPGVDVLDVIPGDRVIEVRDDNPAVFLVDVLRSLRTVRGKRFDAVIDMELFARVTAILAYLSGAPVRLGFHRYTMEGLYRGRLHTHPVVYNPYMHISRNFLSLSEALLAPRLEYPGPKTAIGSEGPALPHLKPSAPVLERVREKLKKAGGDVPEDAKLVLLNPGTSSLLPLRQWSVENYVWVARDLLQEPTVWVVVIGLGEDVELGETICREAGNRRCISLAGKTTFEELLGLLALAKVLVSHDSGPPNFAALTRTPLVVLFGPETPVLYAPMSDRKTIIYKNLACSPCVSAFNHRRSACKDNLCLKAITPEEVSQAARNWLFA